VKWSRFHQIATLVWATLAIPTLLWWKESILWVALMSLYANVVGHWGAYQASRAEEHQDVPQRKRRSRNR
jgi:hypothetical protein